MLPPHTKEDAALVVVMLGGAAQLLLLFSDLGRGETPATRLTIEAVLCLFLGFALGCLVRRWWPALCVITSWGTAVWSMVAFRNGFTGFALALFIVSVAGLLIGGTGGTIARQKYSRQSNTG